jgi:hypothetical protein
MITTRLVAKLSIILVAGILMVPAFSLAQTTCDPLPTDPVLLDECIFNHIINPAPNPPPPPGGPDSPTTYGGSGVRGVSGAYNPTNNTYLIVSTNVSGGVGTIIGTLVDANNNPIGQSFRIDQSSDSGTPRIIYDQSTDRYFAAWEDVGGRNRHIYGRFISSDGQLSASAFPIYTAGDGFLRDIDFNSTTNQYAISLDNAGPQIIFVDQAGTVSNLTNLDPSPGNYNGQGSTAYNSNANEYWVAYVETVARPAPSPGLLAQDNRVYMMKVNASTNQRVGEPLLISNPIPGYFIGEPSIAYNPAASEALIAWRVIDPNVGSEVYTRTVSDSGVLGPINKTLSSTTDSSSDAYGGQIVTYNPWTGVYQLTAWDNQGGIRLLEIIAGGAVITNTTVLAPPSGNNPGNHNSTNFAMPNGAGVLAAANNAQTVGGINTSPFASSSLPSHAQPGPLTAPAPNTQQVGQKINQIYLWSLGAAAALALIMMIVGGYKVMMAGGNATIATSGKELIYSSLVGIIILLGSYLLLTTINTDLTQLDLSSLNQLTPRPGSP